MDDGNLELTRRDLALSPVLRSFSSSSVSRRPVIIKGATQLIRALTSKCSRTMQDLRKSGESWKITLNDSSIGWTLAQRRSSTKERHEGFASQGTYEEPTNSIIRSISGVSGYFMVFPAVVGLADPLHVTLSLSPSKDRQL